MAKHILVTGGNSGIGLALCKLLIKDHGCYVYLGSRDLTRGANALKTILEEVPDKHNQIEVVQIDVGDDQSCATAAKTLGVSTYSNQPIKIVNKKQTILLLISDLLRI